MNTLVPLTMHDLILLVCMVYASDIGLVHRSLGKTRSSHDFDARFGGVSNQTMRNLPS